MKEKRINLDDLIYLWIEYVDEVNEHNKKLVNENKVINNQIAAEDEHFNNLAELYNDKLEKWKQRGWRDYFDEPPIAPNEASHRERIMELQAQLQNLIYPDFTGFMNWLARTRNIIDKWEKDKDGRN